MIELLQVSKTFTVRGQPVHALLPTDLAVPEGRVYGLLGFSAGVKSGLELHMMGLVAGFDFRNPGIKVPAFGRLGV